MTDSQRIDWLESFINESGRIVLHDGDNSIKGYPGLGLRPGSLKRTLREAIDQCAGPQELMQERPQ